MTFLLAAFFGVLLSWVHRFLYEWMLTRISDLQPDRFAFLDFPWKGPMPGEVIRTFRELYPESHLPRIVQGLQLAMYASMGVAFTSLLVLALSRP
jgi:hypothetical protein